MRKKVTPETAVGCPWVTGSHKDRHGDSIDEHCLRIPSKTSAHCPKHELMASERQGGIDRRMEKARRGKERKKLMEDALAMSPLRAVNPKFPHPSTENGSYSR